MARRLLSPPKTWRSPSWTCQTIRAVKGAVCFWEGNALVQLEVVRDGVELVIGLNTALVPRSALVADDLELALEGLEPWPTTRGSIDKRDYRATLRLELV